GQAGLMESIALTLAPGNYTLSFDLAGSQRTDGANIVDVSVGTSANATLFASTTLTRNAADPFSNVVIPFTVGSATTDGRLFFHNRGGDNQAAILDNVDVAVAAVPEPSSLLCLAIGAAGLMAHLRRRRSVA